LLVLLFLFDGGKPGVVGEERRGGGEGRGNRERVMQMEVKKKKRGEKG
jgi:hypothetical protein